MPLPTANIPFKVQKAEDYSDEIIFDVVGLSEALTDLNIGGVARSLLESVAIQLEKLDSKVFFGIERAIPSELYTAFNFPKLAAVKATGTVTFVRTSGTTGDIIIASGTVILAPATENFLQVSFSTTTAVTLLDGTNSINAPVSADVAGIANNVSAGRLSVIQSPISNVDSVSNAAAIKNGKDIETETEREVRFRKFVLGLARSPLAGIESGALTAQLLDVNGIVTERVDKAIVIEPVNTLAKVNVFIDNGGGTATAALVTEAQKIIDGFKDANGVRVPGYKAAGIVAVVAAIVSLAVAVTVQIEIANGFDFTATQTEVQNTIENFFLDLGPGDEMILNDLICAIVAVPGVKDLVMTAPTANQNADSSQRLLSGVVTITEKT